MPLNRYEIRNEYSLADPELYKSADRDDPEALLEGVAMAGLVGVLRQLGDLAEFAAEVFHNLHEEVMATAERGHSLKARVQQLELEFPLIEKAFLSQTNHSDFFYTPGVDWHPNMHIDQNYITRGDLPRFIMDSYEEARSPPQLFLLDKFDVAGAGACLKRFTDPSFFKVEASALGITNADVQRDKVRKGKRRGSRWRNGETPEVLPTPHSKLHELLLEDRVENSASNPARLVKLKRRLNGFPFDLKTGKSYMEKILRTPPDYRELHQVRNSSPLKLEMDYFRSESPDVELTNRSPILSPDSKNGLQNGSMRGMEFETSNESNHFRPESEKDEMGLKSSDFPEGKNNLEVGNIKSNLYEDVVEKQIMVDKENKSESSVYQSDDVASEVENYMDALAAMESEMETDSELRPKSNTKLIPGIGAATSLRKAHLSDSQSMGSSTLSDDGNSASKKWSNSSYSGSPRNLTRKAVLEDELSDEIDSSNETGEAKRISRPLKWRGRTRSAGSNKVAAIPPYKTDDVGKPISVTDVSPGFMVNKDAHASVGENGVMTMSSDSTTSLQVAENYSSSNGNDSHLTESSSSKPITSDDTRLSGEFKDQHMEESVDKNMYLLPDVTAVSCSLDDGPLNCEEDFSSSGKYQTFSESMESMPRAGDGECDSDANPVNQIDSQITTMLSAEEQTEEPRLPSMPQAGDADHEVEAYPVDKQIDSQTTTMMSPAEQQTMEPRLPELETDDRAIDDESAIDDILQPLDPVNRPINNQTEEQFPDMYDKQYPDTSISETEYRSDGADHNAILLGGNTMALPGGEIAVDMEDEALSGIPKGGNTKDIQAPVVLDSVPRPDVETSVDGDEILHELPSLAVTNVASPEETGLFSESLSCELIARSVNLSDADVEGGSMESNLHGVDAEVPFSVTQGELDAEEKEDLQKAASQPVDYDHSDSRVINKISNSDSESESSLLTDVTASSTFEQNGSQENGVLAEKNTLDADSVDTEKRVHTQDASPTSIYHVVEEQKVKSSVEQLDNERIQVSTMDDVGQHNLGSISPAFGLLPEMINTDLAEMPPLPPLPPVQWRMGKKQASLAHESLDNNLPLPETSPDLAAANNSKFPSLSETQSVYQHLPLPAKLDETPRLDDHASTSSNASSSGNNGNEAAACDVQLVVDSSTLSNFNKAQETNQNKILDQGSSSSESNESPHDASALPVEINREQPHNMILSLEGEVAWPDQEEGKPYGIRPMKPPRQRNPLIDAVMALDRSKFRKVTEQPKTNIDKADERDSLLENLQLRKVTEQPRTQILKADERDSVLENLQLRKVTEQPNTEIQKTVERDSLLEQIRARTVNLKPTVVSRPAVQGPTNLKVAAILEKAKTIRQAFAGSDDDDDDDSWSDS